MSTPISQKSNEFATKKGRYLPPINTHQESSGRRNSPKKEPTQQDRHNLDQDPQLIQISPENHELTNQKREHPQEVKITDQKANESIDENQPLDQQKRQKKKQAAPKHKPMINKCRNYTRMFFISLGSFAFGYYLVITNVLAKPLTKGVYGMNKDDQKTYTGYFGSLFSLGAMVSVALSGYLTKSIGRVKLCLVTDIACILHALAYSIESIPVLLLMRFFSGFIGGVALVVNPIISKELFPPQIAPLGGTMSFTVICTFLVVAALTNPIFGGEEGLTKHYRIVLLLPAFLNLLRIGFVAALLLGHETPNYYFERNWPRVKLAKTLLKTMRLFYTEEDAKEVTKQKLKVNDELQRMLAKNRKKGNSAKQGTSVNVGLRALFTRRYRKQFLVACLLNACQQLTGINVIGFFSTQIFDDINGSGGAITVIITFGMFSSAVLSNVVVYFGRKICLVISSIWSGIMYLVIIYGISVKSIAILAPSCYIYVLFYSFGLGSILAVFLSELIPPVGVGISVIFRWLTAAILSLLAPVMMKAIGVSWMFFIFFVLCMITGVFIQLTCVETKGKTQQEIINYYAPPVKVADVAGEASGSK